jgi:hypothetical protein
MLLTFLHLLDHVFIVLINDPHVLEVSSTGSALKELEIAESRQQYPS